MRPFVTTTLRAVRRLRSQLPPPAGMVALCDHPTFAWSLAFCAQEFHGPTPYAWALAAVNAVAPETIGPASNAHTFVIDALESLAKVYQSRGVRTARDARHARRIGATGGTVYVAARHRGAQRAATLAADLGATCHVTMGADR